MARAGTIPETIEAHAAERPDHPAIIGSNFPSVTFRDLTLEIDRARLALRGAGYGHQARIAVAIADSAQAARAIIAVSCCATAIPLDPKLTAPEIERCWDILAPSAVLLLDSKPSVARTTAEARGLPVIEATYEPKLDLQAASIGCPAEAGQPDPDSPAFILHTSGTTGTPNLVPFSHANLLCCTERLKTWFGLTPQDRCLDVTPVYYSHALTTTVFPPLLTGGSIAFPASPTLVDPAEWFGLLEPTWYSAGPTLHLAVLEKIEQGEARSLHGLRFVSSAGAPLAREIHDRMQAALGAPVLQHYGSSETAQVASNALAPGTSKFGTVGIPWPGILTVAGPDGLPVPTGERGEVLIRGPSVTAGYLNPPESPIVSADGWYRTGDIGSLDPDGFLTLHGREKELINRGGEKISPVELDGALLRHPAVAEAAAFGVPHPRLGEDVAAAVVLRPGSTATSSEIRAFLAGQVAPYKTPRRIAILTALPKGTSGKILRHRLRDMMLQAAGHLSEEDVQTKMTAIWNRLLKRSDVGLDEDFFEAGGDSLLAMDVSVEMQRMAKRDLPESLLFEAATIRELSRRLVEESRKPA